jgi:MFS family permease
MIRTHFDLNYTQSGLLISAFSLSYGLGQLPAGWLADRIGPRILITIGICGVAIAGALIGLSSTYLMIIAFLILMGLLGGGYHPAAPALISTSVKPEHLGRSLGLHIIGGSVSYFMAPLIAVAIATAWGWRSPFVVLAVPTIIFGLLFYILLGRLEKAADTKPEPTSEKSDPGSMPRRYHRLVVLIAMSTFIAAILISTISFIPLFLVDNFGISERKAAALLSLVYSAGLWAAPAGGYLSDRLGKIPVLLAVCFIAGPIVYLLNISPYGIGSWVLLLALGISLSVRMPVMESFIVSETSVSNRSTILGIYYFSSMESGGLLTPVMGNLIDRFGFYSSFSLAGAAMFIVTLIGSVWLWGRRK